MKYALINGNKEEAVKGAVGYCPNCGSELIAHCGEMKIHHWAHKGNRNCDPWWENETEWHRSWKGEFPIEWQEVHHIDPDTGERHIADVKTDYGWSLEFQHSYLKPEERRSRTDYYKKLVWVVDGLRRERDKKQIERIISEMVGSNKPDFNLLHVRSFDSFSLLKEWGDCNAFIFFDFDDKDINGEKYLWFLMPNRIEGQSDRYLMKCPKSQFILLHNNGNFEQVILKICMDFHEQLLNNIKAINQRRASQYNYSMRNRAFRTRYKNRL